MKKTIYIFILLSLAFFSCDDFLDKSPDSRVEIDTPEKISKLLISGYSDGNYAVINELSSDNMVDNNSPSEENGAYYNLSSFDKMHDEIFAWEPAVSSTEQDSPSAIWSGCYYAISVANQALEAVKNFEDQGRGSEVVGQKAEALLIRAYHHFILVNEFCQTYKNDELSKNDSGVPYMTDLETKVLVKYNRSTVSDTYNKIEKDLLAGLALISSANYEVPRYHFNKQAAEAFAVRFYLFKRQYNKVVEYASSALGSNPASYMSTFWNTDQATSTVLGYGWVDVSLPNNFLLIATSSWASRMMNTRYACNRDAADGTIYGSGPTWTGYNFNPCYNGRLYIRGSQEYGLFFLPQCYEFFEYTDKIAGIGYGHVVRTEFTAEETLLCRAEAYVYLNKISDAVADLKTFDDSRKRTGYKYTDLSESVIKSFYTASKPLFVKTFNTSLLSLDFTVSDSQKPIIDCVLHFRRLQSIHTGMRWFDLKRYGIEITHKIGKDKVDVLKWDDPRRAIQIPAEVIAAGLSPNYRQEGSGGGSDIMPFK
ncbi:MAG: RagB/SusD family nutrient uptake outer membrane protein [Paludibacteraceae bacterium]